MKIETPLGDVIDRLTILELKAHHAPDDVVAAHVQRSIHALTSDWTSQGYAPPQTLPEWSGLEKVNRALWDVEDELRRHEARQDFGPEFVQRARSVYQLNDQRAALKRSINDRLGSTLVEQKILPTYSSEESS